MKKFIILISFFLSYSCLLAQQYDKLSFQELDSLMNTFMMSGDMNKAMEYAKFGLNKAKKEKRDSAQASMLNAIGYFYMLAGDYKTAEEYIEEALRFSKEKLGEQHIEYASSINSLATLSYQKGDYQTAVSLFRKVCTNLEKYTGKDHPYFAMVAQNLSLLLERLGRYEEAEVYYLESKALMEKNNQMDQPQYLLLMGNLGALYEAMGQEQQAEDFYLDVMSKYKARGYSASDKYVTLLNNLAGLYKKQSRYEEALELYIEAIKLTEKVLGKDHEIYGMVLGNLAGIYEIQKDYKKAEEIYQKSIKVIAEKVGKEDPNYAFSLQNLGDLYVKMKRYDAAEKLLKRALEIRGKVFGKAHYRYGYNLYYLARLYRHTKDYDKAWEHLQAAINSSTGLQLEPQVTQKWADSIYGIERLDYQHFDNLNIILTEAILLLKAQRPEDKKSQQIICNLAQKLIQRARKDFHKEADKLKAAKRLSPWVYYNLAIMDLDANPQKALRLAEQDKASLLLEATQNQRSYNFGAVPDSLIQKEKDLNKILSQIEAKLLTVTDAAKKNQLRSLLNEKSIEARKLKETIQKEYPKYADFKYNYQIAKLEEVQAKLDPKTAVLEYVMSKNRLFIFFISSEKAKIFVQNIKSDSLAEQIKIYHGMLSNYSALKKSTKQRNQSFVNKSHWFYQQTIAPLASELKEIKHLIIIPDGELGHLPFGSFIINKPQKTDFSFATLNYLIKEYSISYDYSLTVWQQNNKKQPKQHKKGVFAAAASYDKLSKNKGRSRLPVYRNLRSRLQALPAAEKEVQALAQKYEGYFAFDSLASEANFKSFAKDYAVIHLAMHGILNEKEPILSALAFTEDGDTVENNFLQAFEISQMELNADLVVLSACETGYGRFERGNGIASLARSFVYAGIPALVVSLWQVSDASTSIIMQKFYNKLTAGLNKAEALRQAKLDYIKIASESSPIVAHPAFWAPFIQLGNSHPLKINKKRTISWIWWTVGGATLLIAGLGFGISRRKSR